MLHHTIIPCSPERMRRLIFSLIFSSSKAANVPKPTSVGNRPWRRMVDEISYGTEPTRETDDLGPVGRDRIGANLLISKRDRGRLSASRIRYGSPSVRRHRSIFLLDVLLHVPPHLDQTAPNLLKERNHLIDLGIAWQLELRFVGLCAWRTRHTG